MELHIYISKKTSRKRKINEKDNSQRGDYYFSFNIDTPQGLTPYIMEEINGREFCRIHIPGIVTILMEKSLASSKQFDFWGNGR